MCNVCGCGQEQGSREQSLVGRDSQGPRHHEHHHRHPHEAYHDHETVVAGAEVHDFGQGPARAHAPGLSQARMVQIERDILSKNQAFADNNRRHLAERGIFAVNLLSSPGAGKTTLLVRTIEALKEQLPLAVIEGDQQTDRDAQRIRQTGVPALQINTGKGCHLDAYMVGRALRTLALPQNTLLFIENVGNLVCPASFDLGEAEKVVLLSATEGDDKPLKYPDIFRVADVMLVNKVDLLPYVQFDTERAIASVRRGNPPIEVLPISATQGDGIADWVRWLGHRRLTFLGPHPSLVEIGP